MSEPVSQTTPIEVGQVWRPKKPFGGMWLTVKGVHPAGVSWTASHGDFGFTRWEKWFDKMEPRHAG
jgi:hypothetical protein